MSEARAAFAHRLNDAFDRLGIPPKQHGRFTALSRLFGVSAVAARDWCEGKSYPSVDKLLVILDTVRCGADWLLYGRIAPASVAGPAMPGPAPVNPPTMPGGEASAAAAADGTQAKAGIQAASGSALAPPAAEAGWYTVDSDCMASTLLPGDRVRGATLAQPLLPTDGVHLLRAVGQSGPALMRRLQRRLDGSIAVSCDNPLYGESTCWLPGPDGRLFAAGTGAAELEVIGRVVEVRRTLP